MASVRNGSGDVYSIVFGAAGVFIRGFDHESPMSPYCFTPPRLWPGIVDDAPAAFADYVAEPAFSLPRDDVLGATFCLWRQLDDIEWHAGRIDFPAGDDPDGSGWLLAALADGSPFAYLRFAEDYYETSLDAHAVEHVYALRPLSQDVVGALNPDLSMADLDDDLAKIGYPVP